MPRIDYFIFGYRKFTVKENDIREVVNIFLSKNISVRFRGNCFFVQERDFKRVKEALHGKIDYIVSDALGIYGFLHKNRFRYGIILAIFVSVLISLFSSSVVWDVRVEGSLLGREEEIIEELSEVGLSVGTFWSRIDKSRIEADMLASSECVSWLNINRRGTVAYISVIDKISFEDPEKKEGYANIVANRDCIIEEISVKQGYAMVKAGETVKKGQILISGVMPLESGGGFCYAEGTVIGRFSDSISVSVSQTEEEKLAADKKLGAFSVNFFGFSINLFKIYRNLPDDCVIIKDNRNLSFFGKVKLPLTIEREYVLKYTSTSVNYTEEEMTELASLRMREALNRELKNSNLLKIKTQGAFSSGVYTMQSDYVCSREVGECVEFEVTG